MTRPPSFPTVRVGPIVLALLALLALGFPGPAPGQGGIELLGRRSNGTGQDQGGGELLVFVTDAQLQAIIAKIQAVPQQKLTRAEFMTYIRAIERLQANLAILVHAMEQTRNEDLPAQGWALISTRLHDTQYGDAGGANNDRRTSVMGIALFLNGSENQDWERIDILCPKSPKFITEPGGELVDIAHSYAGIAALVMRDWEITGTLMGNVNTGWGDGLQVWAGRINGAKTILGGIFTLSGDRIDRGSQTWSNAANFKPDNQVRGNVIGNEARDYLQDHRSDDLSTAYEYAFQQIDGD